MTRPPIGFVLLTHRNPEQILLLCDRLSSTFGNPPIVVHHDFGQSRINTAPFPANVRFVEDWSATQWGGYGIVEGQRKALRDLYRESDPDWFVVLSAADYPIKTGQTILDDLYSNPYNAYLDHREIRECRRPVPIEGFGDQNYIHPAWITLAYERYMAIGFGFYKLATRMKWRKKAVYLRAPSLIRRFTPFDGTLRCFGGDFWLTGDRRTAEVLLLEDDQNRRLYAHFARRPVPDEGVNQTLLCNRGDLRLSRTTVAIPTGGDVPTIPIRLGNSISRRCLPQQVISPASSPQTRRFWRSWTV